MAWMVPGSSFWMFCPRKLLLSQTQGTFLLSTDSIEGRFSGNGIQTRDEMIRNWQHVCAGLRFDSRSWCKNHTEKKCWHTIYMSISCLYHSTSCAALVYTCRFQWLQSFKWFWMSGNSSEGSIEYARLHLFCCPVHDRTVFIACFLFLTVTNISSYWEASGSKILQNLSRTCHGLCNAVFLMKTYTYYWYDDTFYVRMYITLVLYWFRKEEKFQPISIPSMSENRGKR